MISKNKKYTNFDRYKVDVIDNLKELYKKLEPIKDMDDDSLLLFAKL